MSKKITNISIDGLQKLPRDNRDFRLGSVFGHAKLDTVPYEDFEVATPLSIKNQGENTDYCSGYAVTEVSEDHEEVELLAEYQFYLTKKIDGKPEAWGADLRSACKSAVSVGSIPSKGFEHVKEMTREQILSDSTWPGSLKQVASLRKKETFFEVDGPYDTFDNIRLALWTHRNERTSIVTGAIWREGWLETLDGIIPSEYGKNGFGHAFKIFGQKIIDGVPYLKAQLSQGKEVGDGGIFYFSRGVTNKEIGEFGIYMFKDITREKAEYYMSKPYTVNTPFILKVWSIIRNIFVK